MILLASRLGIRNVENWPVVTLLASRLGIREVENWPVVTLPASRLGICPAVKPVSCDPPPMKAAASTLPVAVTDGAPMAPVAVRVPDTVRAPSAGVIILLPFGLTIACAFLASKA